jgi:hypothetical protein
VISQNQPNSEVVTHKWELYKALKEKVLRRCREDSYALTEYIFGYVNSPFHRQWHDFLRSGESGLILACRGSGKTEQVTIGNSLWEIGNNPNIRIKIITETDDLSIKILSKIAETIVGNDRYHEVFPHVEKHATRSWNQHELTVKRSINDKEPTIEAQSILAASTGKRSDLNHYDDIVGMANTLTNPGKREIVKEAFRSNWQKVLDVMFNSKARWIMTATPWHKNDLVSELRENRAVLKAPEVWVGPNFESPWPGVIDSAVFKKALQTDGLRGYNRAYRGIALSDEECWINPLSIKSAIDWNLKPEDVRIGEGNIPFTGVDLGHREGEKACPSVIFTGVRTPQGKRIPIDIKILKNSSVLEIAKALIKTYQELHPVKILVENNGAQKYLIDILDSLGLALPVEGYFTGTQKLDPNVGVPSLLAEIEVGKWIIPLGSGGTHEENICGCNYCVWMNEVKNYPLTNTDTVMSNWLMLTALKRVCEQANAGGNFTVWDFS